MILQALADYYYRKAADPESGIAPEGWEWKEIPFLMVIDKDGHFLAIEDTRETEGKKKRAKTFLVLQGEKKTSGVKSNLLWDNIEYALGANPRSRNDADEKHGAFISRIESDLKEIKDVIPIRSILLFLRDNPLAQIEKVPEYKGLWEEILTSNSNVTFKVRGVEGTTVFDFLRKVHLIKKSDTEFEGTCLVTGKKGKIARLHPAIKGVRGTNTTGGSIVSFNLDSFNSFSKKQNFNAPIGEDVAFAYTTALNTLLGKDSSNKTFSGDASILFWTEKNTGQAYDIEENFSWFLSDPPKDDPDRGVRAVKGLLAAMKTGHLPAFDDNRFYMLGLSPNAARISIRFWRSGTVREFGEKILKHFDDTAIEKGPYDPEHLTVNQMLRATVLDYKMENVPPNSAGTLITSIIDGTQYPISLCQQCIRRIRAERKVIYARAALLKGFLARKNPKGGIHLSLNRNNSNEGYLLGRLFAVLERVQETASPGINTTIRDRFYGAASSSPVSVFSQLLKLKNHHLAKLENKGLVTFFEKEIGEIMNGLEKIPPHLPLEEQAFFAIGYYQQRQDFFKKTTSKNKLEEGIK